MRPYNIVHGFDGHLGGCMRAYAMRPYTNIDGHDRCYGASERRVQSVPTPKTRGPQSLSLNAAHRLLQIRQQIVDRFDADAEADKVGWHLQSGTGHAGVGHHPRHLD